MSKQIFDATGLTTTSWITAENKAKYLNTLVNFVRKDFARQSFTKILYKQLSNSFGMIAHYNLEGFYDYWFETPVRQYEFLTLCLQHHIVGGPEYTYSDVETKFQEWLKSSEGDDLYVKKAIEVFGKFIPIT